MGRRRGSDFKSLKASQRLEMYEHVLYEFGSAFCPPRFDVDNAELRESVYLRVMISIRNLTNFFTFDDAKSYFDDDVFAWQFFDDASAASFKGLANAPPVAPGDLSKINKQIAHLSFSRTTFKGDYKRWRVELRDSLKPSVIGFIQRLFEFRSNEMSSETMHIFRLLFRFLNYNEVVVLPSNTTSSNVASHTDFQALVLQKIPTASHSEPIEIIRLLQ